MKKNIVILFAVILVGVMSGCTPQLEVDENVVKDITNKITESVIDTVGNEKANKNVIENINAEKLNDLNIISSVGDINITTHESTEAVIELQIETTSKTKEKAEELITEFNYTVEEKWNTLNINTSILKDRLISPDGIKVDLTIKIPSSMKNIKIESNVGDLTIDDIDGNIEITSNVGDINIKNSNASYVINSDVGDVKLIQCKATGKSEFNSNVGKIDITFDDINDSESIFIETQVGDIELTIPENSDYKAAIEEFMKDDRIAAKGDEKTQISLITNVGKIDFD